MRTKHVLLATVGFLLTVLIYPAHAQLKCERTAENYYCGKPCYADAKKPGDLNKTCFHRNVSGFASFCPDLGGQPCATTPATTPQLQELATAGQVNTAVNCTIAAAKAIIAEKAPDLLKTAKITEELDFTLVSNTGYGGSLAFGIPVYAATVGPSLSDMNSLNNTSEVTNSFTIDLATLKPDCNKPKADWMNYVILKTDPGQTLSKFTVGLEFYVSKTKDAALSINILSFKIGPQYSNVTDKTQKVCLTFDFEKEPVDPDQKVGQAPVSKTASSCQLGSSGGDQTKASQ